MNSSHLESKVFLSFFLLMFSLFRNSLNLSEIKFYPIYIFLSVKRKMTTFELSLLPLAASEIKDVVIYGGLGILLGIGATKLISHYKTPSTKIKHVQVPNAFESKQKYILFLIF